MASMVCSTALTAQAAPDPCSLASNEEFQRAYEVDPRIGIIPDVPTKTEMVWGPHCDYQSGSITLFTKKTPSAELERVLGLAKAGKQRAPVQGLGQRAFYTVIYPGDEYREQGFLAVFLGPRIVTFGMDAHHDEAVEATRPRLEGLAKLVLPRLK
jgi:hypothetical protein